VIFEQSDALDLAVAHAIRLADIERLQRCGVGYFIFLPFLKFKMPVVLSDGVLCRN